MIRGSAVNNDGWSSGSMGTPSLVGQTELVRCAVVDAGVDPREVSYVEGWYVMAEANRIFGFDGWDRVSLSHQLLYDRREGGFVVVAYHARVRVIVRAGPHVVVREGSGTLITGGTIVDAKGQPVAAGRDQLEEAGDRGGGFGGVLRQGSLQHRCGPHGDGEKPLTGSKGTTCARRPSSKRYILPSSKYHQEAS